MPNCCPFKKNVILLFAPYGEYEFCLMPQICLQLRRVNNLHLAMQPKYETPDSLHIAQNRPHCAGSL